MSAAGTHSEAAGAKEIACGTCRAPFRPKRGWQKFCSDACRNAFHHRLTPEAMRRELDQALAAAEQLRRDHEALKAKVDQLEAAAMRAAA